MLRVLSMDAVEPWKWNSNCRYGRLFGNCKLGAGWECKAQSDISAAKWEEAGRTKGCWEKCWTGKKHYSGRRRVVLEEDRWRGTGDDMEGRGEYIRGCEEELRWQTATETSCVRIDNVCDKINNTLSPCDAYFIVDKIYITLLSLMSNRKININWQWYRLHDWKCFDCPKISSIPKRDIFFRFLAKYFIKLTNIIKYHIYSCANGAETR